MLQTLFFDTSISTEDIFVSSLNFERRYIGNNLVRDFRNEQGLLPKYVQDAMIEKGHSDVYALIGP